MKIHFMTRCSPSKKKDESSESLVPLWVRLFHGNKLDLWQPIGVMVNPNYWDNKSQSLKSRILLDDDYRASITSKVNELRLAISKAYYEDIQNGELNKDWLRRTVELFHKNKKGTPTTSTNQHAPNFSKVFDSFLSSRDICAARRKQYEVVKRAMLRYELFMRESTKKGYRLNLKKFDTFELEKLSEYLANESSYFETNRKIFEQIPDKKTMKPRGHNTVLDILKKISVFFNWCVEKKIIAKSPFKGYVVGQAMYGTPFYLTLEELHSVYSLDLSNDVFLDQQRDVFVFQCCVGCRIGDLYKLTRDDLVLGTLQYVPNKTFRKTQRCLVVPLNSMAKSICLKYSGEAFPDNKFLPLHHIPQEYNSAIRDVLTIANITRKVSVINPLTSKEEKRPINEVASSHMARRTFVGNLYKKVKDPNLVGALSGHVEGSRAFCRYREIDQQMKQDLVNLLD